MSRAETILWTRLRRRQVMGLQFRRQLPIGPFIADFACVTARLVVEVDGVSHASPEQHEQDEARLLFLESEGWSVLRVRNEDVFRDETGVVEVIMDGVRAAAGR